MATPARKPRYVFGEFVLSPARRVLLRNRAEVALIPRYFDLLVLLVERRGEAVHRRQIFDTVWTDVVVSDGALSQAVRTLRRALGDDPREPAFIRTVSRHGYRFVFPQVVTEPDDEPPPLEPPPALPRDEAAPGFDALFERLLAPGPLDDEERREAAEALHALGTEEALLRLDGRRGHARARAVLRDTRWDVAHAGSVPILGQPDLGETVGCLLRLRWHRTIRLARARWAGALAGGAMAGVVAAVALALAGSYLGAMSLDFMAHAFPGSEVGLAPLARLLGEEEPGAVTRVAISGFEGLLFGAGLALGLTRRPSGDASGSR